MGGWSYYGIGVRNYGLEAEPPEYVVLTQWFALLFVPVVPLRRIRCRYLGEGGTLHENDGKLLDLAEHLPLSASSIVATYLWSWVFLLVTIGPVAFLIWHKQGRGATIVEAAVMLGCAICLGLSPFAIQWRQKRILEASRGQAYGEMLRRRRADEAEAELTRWKTGHVLSERFYLLSGLVGLIPGAAVAVWLGWDPQLAVVTAVLAVAVVHAFDRLLMKRRRDKISDQDNWMSPY